MKSFFRMFRSAVTLTAVLIVLCGVAYPLALTATGQLLFHKQANGSLIELNGQVVGSELIGQQFTDQRYFMGRVSSVNYNTYMEGDAAYGGPASGSFNYGATNPELKTRVEADMEAFLVSHPDAIAGDIPMDLLTASGSGLDPHISPQAAMVQIPAIAKATGLTEESLKKIVKDNTKRKVVGIFGEDSVNVLEANIAIAQAIGVI